MKIKKPICKKEEKCITHYPAIKKSSITKTKKKNGK